jgi:predicted alternative tryptophan synthase beta-subunit
MAMILENQAKQLLNETSQTGGTATFTAGTGEQWAGVALPLVRKVFGQISSKEFVSVQPMNLPSGLVFYLDFQYGTNKTPFSAGSSMYGDRPSSK